MKRRIAIVLLAALAASALVAGAAGAGSASARAAAHPIRFASVPQIRKYLRARHISTVGMVVQRGAHNYAGPRCPGSGWICTKATRVLQVANPSSNGQNTFECTATPASSGSNPPGFPPEPPFPFPGFPTTTNAPTDCVIVQINSSGAKNTARCVIRSTMNPVTESCAIYQQNTTGANDAFIEQVIRQTQTDLACNQPPAPNPPVAGACQVGTQQAAVEQHNRSGPNSVQSKQRIDQSSTQGGDSVEQSQTPSIYVSVQQSSDSGRNSAHGDQTVQDDETAASKAASGNQNQYSRLEGHVTQNSIDVSEAAVRQHEDLDQKASKDSTVDQSASGPMECCSNQSSNPNDRFDLDQSSSLSATSPFASQQTFIDGLCESSGICRVDQFARVNGASEHNSCNHSDCAIGIECFSGGEETFTAASSPGTGFCFPTSPGGGSERLGSVQGRSALKRAS